MSIIRPNAIRIKRFREIEHDLRTRRDRLLVGIDIAKAQHVAQVRLAHTRTTGCAEIVCALEPTGTYHRALARLLEVQGPMSCSSPPGGPPQSPRGTSRPHRERQHGRNVKGQRHRVGDPGVPLLLPPLPPPPRRQVWLDTPNPPELTSNLFGA